jgi:hypothetical protein
MPLSQRTMVGKQGLEPRLPGPGPGALTLTLHPADRTSSVDRPGFEPGNLLLARELLYQLELAAQGCPT